MKLVQGPESFLGLYIDNRICFGLKRRHQLAIIFPHSVRTG